MIENYKVDGKENKVELEEDIYRLVTLIIESSFYYDSKNKLVITKTQSEVAIEINESLDEYCKLKSIDKKYAIQIAKRVIRNNNELKFNSTERKMAMHLLNIEDEDGQR